MFYFSLLRGKSFQLNVFVWGTYRRYLLSFMKRQLRDAKPWRRLLRGAVITVCTRSTSNHKWTSGLRNPQSSGSKTQVVMVPCKDTTWQAGSLRGPTPLRIDLRKMMSWALTRRCPHMLLVDVLVFQTRLSTNAVAAHQLTWNPPWN